MVLCFRAAKDPPVTTWLGAIRNFDERLTALLDGAFAPAINPLRHLGALAFLSMVVTLASGVVAFALYDTSVAGAYESGLRLQKDPWLLGRLLRGLHRYGADAFMLLSLLHLVREAARGHYAGVRWFSWISGVPLLWLLWIAGITGFWLLWDDRALYSVNATAEWLQALPVMSDVLVRNFLTPQALNDRFFSLIVFVHIGVPLFLLAGVWVHVQRLSQVRIWPPRPLTVSSLVLLAVLSLLVPAESLGPADTTWFPVVIPLDWFYLFLHPLVDGVSAAGAWALLLVVSLLLFAMPWLVGWGRRAPATVGGAGGPAVVDLKNCNGCSRCAADCPFDAVVMVPRSDHSHHRQQAFVITDQCAACGICVGSCPSSTPFRRIEDIVSGIELPGLPVATLRRQLQEKLSALSGADKVAIFSCAQAARLDDLADASLAVIPIECSAMLPPSFVEYALRWGAQGVVIAGCREGDCEYRLGDRWTQQRMTGEREPRLRAAAPRDRMEVVWSGNQQHLVLQAVSQLRTRFATMAAPTPSSNIETDHE